METKNKIRVLVVDDSALVRKILSDLLQQDPMIEVVGTASDGTFALRKVEALKPDVVTLDVEMPQKGGLELLPELMSVYPVPVIMVSGVTERGAVATIKALELGAVDFVTKPSASVTEGMPTIAATLIEKIKAVAGANIRRRLLTKPASFIPPPRITIPPLPKGSIPRTRSGGLVIGMGASTGGTEALKDVLVALPKELPPIMVVQHMPEGFTRAFANRLNGLCELTVKEAEDHEPLESGKALIAPGHSHMLIQPTGMGYIAVLSQSEPVMRHRPSVDVLFHSLAREIGPNALGVIMTGMGADGARGLTQMRETGSRTIAQNEQTCVVFGMPKEAIEMGGAEQVLPLQDIPKAIVNLVRNGFAKSD
ncbi:MAG TPA: chemotaxis response regulator protein-glutamate methylesterase [bacterium]|nr:chemotaxis response regulator protein-glutamate methylesterase [bacterium]HPO07218.1 chemotaxis response regulator protein-glutamate methylesterase [bacterium]HQP97671.1 chemotaxis response regulator protein-glutamate methylesterase [bacterium]